MRPTLSCSLQWPRAPLQEGQSTANTAGKKSTFKSFFSQPHPLIPRSLTALQLPPAAHDRSRIRRHDRRWSHASQCQVCCALVLRGHHGVLTRGAGTMRRRRLHATSGGGWSRWRAGAWRVKRCRCAADRHWQSSVQHWHVSWRVMPLQALLDMWAAMHTREAAVAACEALGVEAPSLHDDALASVR